MLLNALRKRQWMLATAALGPLCATAQDGDITEAERVAVEVAAEHVAAGEHPQAINAVLAVIDAVERRANRYDPALPEPLVVLGDALVGIGNHEGAAGAYDRALQITRIGRGLHHPSQARFVYRQAALLAKQGRANEANQRHEYAYRTLLRAHGAGDPALLPGLFVLADWYLSVYNIFAARALYEHAAEMIAEKLPEDDPVHVKALRGLANTYVSERFPPHQALARRTRRGSKITFSGNIDAVNYQAGRKLPVNRFSRGQRALIQIVAIACDRPDATQDGAETAWRFVIEECARPDATGADVAAALLELGDWFLLFDKRGRALTLYRKVWELLASNKVLLARAFAAPTALYLPMPDDPKPAQGARWDDARDGLIELAVHVDANGLVVDMETVRSEPGNLMEPEVRLALRRARYRPAFDGQAPQATTHFRVVHDFTYYPSGTLPAEALRESARKADTETPSAIAGLSSMTGQ